MHRIIHHTDLDGFASAAIIYYHLTRIYNIPKTEICFIPLNYGMTLREDKFDYENDQFYMVDFTLQPDEKMVSFCKKAKGLIWIDHHETALDTERVNSLENVRGLRQSGVAGCELTWAYYFEAKMPKLFEYIGMHDTWRNTDKDLWENTIVPFVLFLSSIDLRPSMNIEWWVTHIENVFPEYLWRTQGEAIQRHVEKQSDIHIRKGFKGKFSNMPAYFINRGENSRIFEKYEEAKDADLWVSYTHYKGTYWIISLYSIKPNIHCGEIAKWLGEAGPIPSGGGHAGAAGFQTTWEYFWSLVTVETNEMKGKENERRS